MATRPEGPYTSAWKRHRRRRRVFWLLLLGYVPGVALLGAWLGRVFQTSALFLPLVIGWMAGLAVAFACSTSFRSPRCGERFYRRGREYRNEFARKCVNCGLRKGAADAASLPG